MIHMFTLFFLVGTLAATAQPFEDRIAAIVNGEPILLSDVKSLQARHKEAVQLDPRLQEVPIDTFQSTPKTLNILIDQILVDQYIRNQKWESTNQEIDREIQRKARELGIDLKTLESILISRGSNMQEYRKIIKGNLEKQTLYGREISPRIAVSEEEIRSYYYQTRGGGQGSRRLNLWLLTGPNSGASEAKVQQSLSVTKNIQQTASAMGGAFRVQQLGRLNENELNSEFQKVLKGLSKGQISAPITIAGTIHVFYIQDVDFVTSDSSWERYRESLYNELMQREFVKQLGFWTTRQRENSQIRINL